MRRWLTSLLPECEARDNVIAVASELAVTDHENAGPRAVRGVGGYCVPSATRAVRALEHLWHHACHRRRMEAA